MSKFGENIFMLIVGIVAIFSLLREIKNNKRFLGILTFLTRIPIKVNVGFDEDFHKGLIYFPSVGFILGVLYFIITYISVKVFGYYIGTVIFLISQCILTGGLHLDGVGDTFDGIYSYRDKDRILEIMKDSRLGTNALLAILFLVLLKLGFVFSIISKNVYYPLVLAPVFGRLAIVFACYKNKSPRENGMGNVFINKVTESQIASVIASTLGITLFTLLLNLIFGFVDILHGSVIGYNTLFVIILFILVRIYTEYISNIIGGITGDILGCICELSELLYLIFIYMGVYKW
ncbi:adenosylcobinamide-GDP ribazoletransferase [Tepidibacter formicigenes]|jgi:adenosylcobinamide-GDP ribazoletransferase|uniref:Adenosylcobinamide-GDP ribazoletransferase n=1 Tax=Tepidibacter formicigenes DSM 15518 TaxID=1123349 RepID=A0A1M6N3T0_9FIRM|nr:adenosylcobinamide-GDP ribazoletransferase [Tepidibacter formicigenes]SHJ90322.1 cobalamin-5'-phosphate synthase [Tepidibacter formicigenes DSM 15518]